MKSLSTYIQENLSKIEEADHSHSEELIKATISYEKGLAKELIDSLVIVEKPDGYEYYLVGEEDKPLYMSHAEIDASLYKNYRAITHDYNVSEAYTSCVNLKAMNSKQLEELLGFLKKDQADYYVNQNMLFVDPTTMSDFSKEKINVMLKH